MIDLRSDTVTRPTAEMREVMAAAAVGDDVYGEDPTVNRLQRLVADLSGHEAGLFLPSGTQGNLLALLSHCERGDEYIAGQQAHCYKYEAGGAACFGSIQPQPLDFLPDGSLDHAAIRAAVKPADDHFARSRLICLENTQAGRVLDLDYQHRSRVLAEELGLKLHLDGARVWNAAVASGESLRAICSCYHSVSLCLSKGLGAPVGSVLVGSHDFICRAHRWRKMAGGGMRQAGILAAAGEYAVQKHFSRLADDHANARLLADGLAQIDTIEVDLDQVQSNMVFVRLPDGYQEKLKDFLQQNGVLVGGYGELRLVTHLDISRADVLRTLELVRTFFCP